MRPHARPVEKDDEDVPEAQGALRIQIPRTRELELEERSAGIWQKGWREQKRECDELVDEVIELAI